MYQQNHIRKARVGIHEKRTATYPQNSAPYGALTCMRSPTVLYWNHGTKGAIAMKITIESIPEGSESEIIIRCNEPDDSLLQLIYALKSPAKGLSALPTHRCTSLSPRMSSILNPCTAECSFTWRKRPSNTASSSVRFCPIPHC